MDQVQTYRRLKNNTVTLGTIRLAMDHRRDTRRLRHEDPPWHPKRTVFEEILANPPPAHFTFLLLSRAREGIRIARDHSPNKALSVYRMRNRREIAATTIGDD